MGGLYGGKCLSIVVACAAITSLAACTARYKLPATATATATLVVERANKSAGLTTASNQFLSISGQCQADGATITGFGPLDGSRKTATMEAGRKLTFTALTRYHYTSGVTPTAGGAVASVDQTGCHNRFAFEPKAGESYRVRQLASMGSACQVEVVSLSTGRAPSDLEHLEPHSC